MRVLKKTSAAFLLIVLIFFSGCGKPTDLSKKHLTIATGSKSGIYYPVGETIAKIIKEKFKDVQIEILETEGSVQNLSLLKDGKANLAFVQNDIAHYAYYGENMFLGKKIEGIYGIVNLFPEVVHIIARKASDPVTLASLAGKKVALGTENSGTFYNAQQITGHAKIWDQIQRIPLSPTEAIAEFEKGEVDAFFFSTGIPNSKIFDLASRTEIAFVPLEPELIQELVNSYPFYFPSEIATSAYAGIASEVSALEINAMLVSNKSLSDDDHYLVARTLLDSLEIFKSSHPALQRVSNNSIRRQMSVPISPGAQKALSE